MKIEIKVPEVGESVQEAVLAEWFKKDGETVRKDDPLFLLETDKVTLEVAAEAAGVLRVSVPAGETVAIGSVVGTLDDEGAPGEAPPPSAEPPAEAPAAKPSQGFDILRVADLPPASKERPPEQSPSSTPTPPAAEPSAPPAEEGGEKAPLPPSARRLAREKGVDVSKISGTGPGGRITKGDVLLYLEGAEAAKPPRPEAPGTDAPVHPPTPGAEDEPVRRKPMSPIRRRIAERLLEARRNTAMLTTFNEIDMGRVQVLRKRYREPFEKKHGVRLGMMSFFIKASVEALKEFPAINAYVVDDKDIEYHDYYHVGMAIGADRGLVVPVIRHADRLTFAGLERAIMDYVDKFKENRLDLKDLEGGTFTITNGGVYGSLLSTPILNTPQSGILGLHKIEDRPVAMDGQVTVRPMMYVALSYDHRIVDGREAVTFLRRIKEFMEEPERMLIEI